MNKRNLLTVGGVAALSFALIALPSAPARSQNRDDSTIARLRQKIAELQARLDAHRDTVVVQDADTSAELASEMAFDQADQAVREDMPEIAQDVFNLVVELGLEPAKV